MQSSRDSSIWRSLAVAFGDGVAFGVGVKLAQGTNRPATAPPSAAAPPPALDPVSGRLEQFEQRLSNLEQTPPGMSAPAPAPFDQKVLEAVVNALDARLKEQSGQVERRLTELEAKLAIDLKTLERQDNAIATGLQKRLEDVHGQYNEHVIAIRDAVAEDMDTLYNEIAKIRQEASAPASNTALVETIDARISESVASQIESHMGTMEDRMHIHVLEAAGRSAQQASLATAAQLEERIAQVQTALAEKDREIADLRQRIADADQSVLDLILAMGQMCRQVAERIAAPAPAAESRSAAPPTAPPDDTPSADPPPPSEPPSAGTPPDEDPKAEAFAAEPELSAMEVMSTAPVEAEVNGHAGVSPILISGERPSRLWRIPLVSTFLIIAAGSFYALH